MVEFRNTKKYYWESGRSFESLGGVLRVEGSVGVYGGVLGVGRSF